MSLSLQVPHRPPALTTSWVGATAAPMACGACLIAGATYVVLDDPTDGTGGLTVCPYRAMTGFWCPGCGITRASRHLARGHVLQALSLNVMAPLFLMAIAIAWWTWLRVASGHDVPGLVRRLSTRTYVAAATVVMLFAVIRNLPGAEVLRGG